MPISPSGIDFIKAHEGCALTAYQDGGGIWTIGYGHTGNVHEGDTITQDQADALLVADCEPAEDAIDSKVTVPLNTNQYDALGSFTFNIGVENFENSTLLKLLNAGDYQGAADQFGRWVHDAAGNVEPGLVRRREDEKELFLT